MKRIVIGILAILMLIATMPVAAAVADEDDDDGTFVSCKVRIGITVAGDEIPLGPALLVRNQKFGGALFNCDPDGADLAGPIEVTQSSINFFTGSGFEGRFGGTFNIGDGEVTGRLGGTVSVAFSPIDPKIVETITGGWRSDDPDGSGTLDIILEQEQIGEDEEGNPILTLLSFT